MLKNIHQLKKHNLKYIQKINKNKVQFKSEPFNIHYNTSHYFPKSRFCRYRVSSNIRYSYLLHLQFYFFRQEYHKDEFCQNIMNIIPNRHYSSHIRTMSCRKMRFLFIRYLRKSKSILFFGNEYSILTEFKNHYVLHHLYP